MRNKGLRLTLILISVSLIIIYIINENKNKVFMIDSNNITSIIIQYKTQSLTIKDEKKVRETLEKFSDLNFVSDRSSLGHKGWVYNIKIYSDNKQMYNFQIVSQDTIIYKNRFYITDSNNIDMDYFKELFLFSTNG